MNLPAVPGPAPSRVRQLAGPVSFLVFALFLRLAFWFYYGALMLPDSVRYLPVGEALFTRWTGGISDTPGVAFLVGLIHLGLGRSDFLFPVQCCLDAVSALWVWWIGRELGLGRFSLVPALYHALNPSNLLFASAALSETLFTFVVTGTAWSCLRLRQQATWLDFTVPGLIAGYAAVTRANGVVLLGLAMLYVGVLAWRSRRLTPMAATFLAAVPLVGGWVGFNAYHNQIYGICKGTGWQLVQGLAHHGRIDPATLPEEFRGSGTDEPAMRKMRSQVIDGAGSKKAMAAVDDWLLSLAWRNIADQPMGYLTAVKDSFFLDRLEVHRLTREPRDPGTWERRGATSRSEYPRYVHLIRTHEKKTEVDRIYGKLTWVNREWRYTVLNFGLVAALGTGLCLRRWRFLWLLCLPLSNWLLLTAMLNTIDRYFLPFESLTVVAWSWTLVIWVRVPLDFFGSTAPKQAPGHSGFEEECRGREDPK